MDVIPACCSLISGRLNVNHQCTVHAKGTSYFYRIFHT